MKTVAFLIVGPGEGDRWLEEVLAQLWTDEIAICLNNADDKTKAIAQRYATHLLEDNREWGKNQWRIKQDFLDSLKLSEGDWVWCLDADEVFPGFTKERALELMNGKDVGYYFWCLQLWNTPDRVRLDMSFPNVRFYKYVPALGTHFQATALHCGLAPMYAYKWGSQTNLHFRHYGLMLPEDRKKKVARYDKYDPKAVYKGKSWYDGLRNEKAHTVSIDEALTRLPETIRRKKEVRDMKTNKVTVYIFRNKHGRTVEAVGEQQYQQFLKTPGMKFLQDMSTPQSRMEAPVVKVPINPEPTHDEPKVESAPASQPSASVDKPRGRGRAKKGDK